MSLGSVSGCWTGKTKTLHHIRNIRTSKSGHNYENRRFWGLKMPSPDGSGIPCFWAWIEQTAG